MLFQSIYQYLSAPSRFHTNSYLNGVQHISPAELLQDISWDIIKLPTQYLRNKQGEPLCSSQRSKILFRSQTRLQLWDRLGKKSSFINVQGTVDDVLLAIHNFYCKKSQQYKKAHTYYGSGFGNHNPVYEADFAIKHSRLYTMEGIDGGWYVGDKLWFEAIRWNGAEWVLHTRI